MCEVKTLVRRILQKMSDTQYARIKAIRAKIAHQDDDDDDYLLERDAAELNELMAELQNGASTEDKEIDELTDECDRYTPDIIWWEIIILLLTWAKDSDKKKKEIIAEAIRENIAREQEYTR